MKKIVIGAVLASAVLVGCSNDDQTEEVSELKQEVEKLTIENEDLLNALREEREAFKEVLEKGETGDTDGSDQSSGEISLFPAKEIERYPVTLVDSMNLDAEGDQVEIYVNAEKGEDGELLMDDGQNWLFVVTRGDKTYPLYDDYLQLGEIDFRVVPIDGEPAVIGIHTAHENITITQYTYDADEDAYVGETVYEIDNF